jgi:hypothetical protein
MQNIEKSYVRIKVVPEKFSVDSPREQKILVMRGATEQFMYM